MPPSKRFGYPMVMKGISWHMVYEINVKGHVERSQ